MLERDNHDLKLENRKLKQVMDSSPRSMLKQQVNQDTGIYVMSSTHRTSVDSTNIENKKELLKKILKTSKLLERYVSMKKTNPDDPELGKKLKEKMPQFEYAVKKLEKLKNECKFSAQISHEANSGDDKNFTMILNSTIKDSTSNAIHDSKNAFNNTTCNESFNKSVKSLLNSLKTDHLSKMSDQNYLRELKQNSLAENEKIFEEKLKNLEHLLSQLKN